MTEVDRPPDANQTGLTRLSPRQQDHSAFVQNVPARVVEGLQVFRDVYGRRWVTNGMDGVAHDLAGAAGNAFVHRYVFGRGVTLKPRELKELIEALLAHAQLIDDVRSVWVRIAPVDDGVLIDLGCGAWVRLRAGQAEVVVPLLDVFFYRPATMAVMPVPADIGDLTLLDAYWNLSDVDKVLMRALATYLLCHAKQPGSVFPILVVIGPQGTGKSIFCRLFQMMLDPTSVELRSFPRTVIDLALAVQKSHLVVFDNLRRLPQEMADALCISVSGGSIETRELFTNSGTVIHRLHGAVALNSLHAIIDQQDLGQRCLPVTLRPLDGKSRRSEQEILASFKTDLPAIFRGLLDLAAAILAELPHAKPQNVERLVAFSTWLAAMERVEKVPDGVYQAAYSNAVDDVMREGLLEDTVGAAIVRLMDGHPTGIWRDTPEQLLTEVRHILGVGANSCEWVRNSITLAKHLRTLEVGLARAGYVIETGRSRKRWISITRKGGPCQD